MFKISPIVVARRVLDLNKITYKEFITFYNEHIKNEYGKKQKNNGGDFWNTQNVRIDKNFGSAIVSSAKEGRLPFQDAYRLTGLSGLTFENYAKHIGLPLK